MKDHGRVSGRALEIIRFAAIGLLSACVLLAIEERLYWLRIPPLAAGAPWLGLLLSLAVGYIYGNEHGAVTGLGVGFLADCLSDGIMLRPLAYMLVGWLAGVLADVLLAHNLPSFPVYAAVGAGIEGLFRYAAAMLTAGGFISGSFFLYEVLPHLLMTVIFSPVVYGLVKVWKKFG